LCACAFFEQEQKLPLALATVDWASARGKVPGRERIVSPTELVLGLLHWRTRCVRTARANCGHVDKIAVALVSVTVEDEASKAAM